MQRNLLMAQRQAARPKAGVRAEVGGANVARDIKDIDSAEAGGPRTELRGYEGVRVFSATLPTTRDGLGERVTAWLRTYPDHDVVTAIVTQSSGERFHCITVALFWRRPRSAARSKPMRSEPLPGT
jgi:hypothetical protein